MMMRTTLLLTAALTLAAATAQAERADHPKRLMQLLSAIDLVPSAEDLRQAAGDPPEAALFQVALDADVSLYERRRATSLLSHFRTRASEAYLTTLATAMPEDKLRWIATYTYVRGWATEAPERAVAFADLVLDSPVALDRDAAVRGLRWIRTAAADALLKRADKTEKDPMVRAALRRVLQQR